MNASGLVSEREYWFWRAKSTQLNMEGGDESGDSSPPRDESPAFD